MKKKVLIIIVYLIFSCCLICLSGCFFNNYDDDIAVVCTMFPQYDWIKNIIGETSGYTFEVLADSGVDLHNYQPTADDIIKIKTCDVFIYVGGESDEWVKDVLNSESTNSNMIVINLMDILAENAIETEHLHDEEHSHDEEHLHFDEHVWLSLKNADLFVENIAQNLILKYPEHALVFEQNATEYRAKLATLDNQYQQAVLSAQIDTVVFADRFPFAYLFKDYGINYFAAFDGCSTESEATLEVIINLAKQVDLLNLKYVLVTDVADNTIAQSVINNTVLKNQSVLVLNSFQRILANDIYGDISYLKIMTENLDILQRALNN